MIVTIDTNVLINGFKDPTTDQYFITQCIVRHNSTGVGCDSAGYIACEYRRHLGGDRNFQKWYQRLQQLQKLYCYDHHISKHHLIKLKALGCHETSDHVFIGVAFHAGKVLISEDSDVGKGPRGNQPPHPRVIQFSNTIPMRANARAG